MKTVILAGGFGTRLSEETVIRPKPMVEIGGKPVLWHIMKIYSTQGFNEFVICLGYKGETIRKFFEDLFVQLSDLTFNTFDGSFEVHRSSAPNWKVTLVDTGLNTLTGGRLLRASDFIKDDEFMMTYGDGLADINLSNLIALHKKHGKLATVTAVRLLPRFGHLEVDQSGRVKSFEEKVEKGENWVNGGFFVLNKKIFGYIGSDEPYFEDYPLRNIARDGELYAYKHLGFWRPMDTMSDKRALDELWSKGEAPWKIWKD